MRDRSIRYQKGSVLVLVVVSVAILLSLGGGLLTVAYGVRHRAIAMKNEAAAMLAAEAGYEKAVFWMSQQPDVLDALLQDVEGTSGTIELPNAHCDYNIEFFSFIGSRPIYKITSHGHSGLFNRTVEVPVLQAIGGWESPHRVPNGPASSLSWPFATGEILDIPIHVNKHDDNPDAIDIYIIGSPHFKQMVSVGESKGDKYPDSVMKLFEKGICFNQPDSKIDQKSVVQKKVDRFKDTTKPAFTLKPVDETPSGSITRPNAAVQLEFFVEGGVGKVRITNNCTVRGYQDGRTTGKRTYDYKINDGSGDPYTKYDIYGYHVRPTTESPITIPVTDTYVTQKIGGAESKPGGQIFIDGNVVIGGNNSLHNNDQRIKGKVTIVATGNIWVADSMTVDGAHGADGMPSKDNPNILGLIAQGVIKVVDPGMSDYSYVDDTPVEPTGFAYVPVARPDGSTGHCRELPSSMIVEAALTVGGGGWGAEHVGERKTTSWSYDKLIVRGTISEAMRGIVGTCSLLSFPDSSNGYMKYYYMDRRLLQGILPGDIWMKGKYIPVPAGWHDYRPSS